MFSIEFSNKAEKQLKKLSYEIQKRIALKIDQLAINPRPVGATKLYNGSYRIRVGDYRIIYLIEDEKLIITIIKIAHRKDIYDS